MVSMDIEDLRLPMAEPGLILGEVLEEVGRFSGPEWVDRRGESEETPLLDVLLVFQCRIDI
jgi:hypothetical protein